MPDYLRVYLRACYEAELKGKHTPPAPNIVHGYYIPPGSFTLPPVEPALAYIRDTVPPVPAPEPGTDPTQSHVYLTSQEYPQTHQEVTTCQTPSTGSRSPVRRLLNLLKRASPTGR